MASISSYGVSSSATVPLSSVISKVKAMATYSSSASKLARELGLAIQTVTWEDCARSKGSIWGPCISDMTLQVDSQRMPVLREPNFTDKTWDVAIDKFPVAVGNHVKGGALTSISLKQYLEDVSKWTSAPVSVTGTSLLAARDSHVIVSSQCCFLPVETGKETKFNVALYSYQSSGGDPSVLTVVCTSKGASAQVVEGRQQLLLFNNGGVKADFSAQRLKDSRRERGVAVEGEMSREEKQDNVIVIVQIPLKQKRKAASAFSSFGDWEGELDEDEDEGCDDFGGGGYGGKAIGGGVFYGASPATATASFGWGVSAFAPKSASRGLKRKKKTRERADVESAIVKVAERTSATCKCGADLSETTGSMAYGRGVGVNCDLCRKSCAAHETVYHCSKGKVYPHRNGYDLCLTCAMKQLQFDETKGITIERDGRYPIRVTLQYYKSTANGVVDKGIMQAIDALLKSSKKSADFVGSLVTDSDPMRPTEWLKTEAGFETVGAVLREVGCFESHFPKFKEQEINDANMAFFENADDFKCVFPKAGSRMRFFAALRKQRSAAAPKREEVSFMDGLF